MKITNCRTNHLENPLGYALPDVRFSWTVEQANGTRQKAARIVVRRGEAIAADTGWAELDSLAAQVEVPLAPRTRYTWTVAVRTDAGEEAESGENWFETGKMEEPWHAAWIGCDDGERGRRRHRRNMDGAPLEHHLFQHLRWRAPRRHPAALAR